MTDACEISKQCRSQFPKKSLQSNFAENIFSNFLLYLQLVTFVFFFFAQVRSLIKSLVVSKIVHVISSIVSGIVKGTESKDKHDQ